MEDGDERKKQQRAADYNQRPRRARQHHEDSGDDERSAHIRSGQPWGSFDPVHALESFGDSGSAKRFPSCAGYSIVYLRAPSGCPETLHVSEFDKPIHVWTTSAVSAASGAVDRVVEDVPLFLVQRCTTSRVTRSAMSFQVAFHSLLRSKQPPASGRWPHIQFAGDAMVPIAHLLDH